MGAIAYEQWRHEPTQQRPCARLQKELSSRGIFATNGQLVEKARSIIEGIGLKVATPDQAREIIELSR